MKNGKYKPVILNISEGDMKMRNKNIPTGWTVSLGLVALLFMSMAPVLARPPHVVQTIPANENQKVDPALNEMVVVFDQDMSTSGFSICGGGPKFPQIIGRPRWVNRQTLSMRIRLKPNHEYELSINCSSAQNFRNTRGESVLPYPVRFKTAANSAEADSTGPSPPAITTSSQSQKLKFSLPDLFGRKVSSEDYYGVPLIIDIGACWCGGCQQGAAPLREFAAEYRAKGLQVIRIVAGDNDLSSLDFQKHYRLPLLHLLDTNRTVEKKYNSNGWPFFMIVDGRGNVVYSANRFVHNDLPKVTPILNNLLSSPPSSQPILRDGLYYQSATLKRSGELQRARRRDRFSSLTAGPEGKLYCVFTTNRNGNSDVFFRIYDGRAWSPDRPLAASANDEYDPTILLDKQNHLWVTWTADAKDRNYDIYYQTASDPVALAAASPRRITDSDDDAMHARLACDEKGRVWLTYYKWEKWEQLSRDREIYLRRWQNGSWSPENHISPTDVPRYEDHSDPVLATLDDNVVLAWCWDYHQPKGYTKQCELPSVFVRGVDTNLELQGIVPLSGKDIDADPALVSNSQGRIWGAWHSLTWDRNSRRRRKVLCVRELTASSPTPGSPFTRLGSLVVNVCTPAFAVHPSGKLSLVWAQTITGNMWTLQHSAYQDQSNRWSSPKILVTAGDPRFPAAAYDSNGRLWIAYSARTDSGREIVVKKF